MQDAMHAAFIMQHADRAHYRECLQRGAAPVLTNWPQMAIVVSKVVFPILQKQQGEPVFSLPCAHAVERMTEAAGLLSRSRIDPVALNSCGRSYQLLERPTDPDQTYAHLSVSRVRNDARIPHRPATPERQCKVQWSQGTQLPARAILRADHRQLTALGQ